MKTITRKIYLRKAPYSTSSLVASYKCLNIFLSDIGEAYNFCSIIYSFILYSNSVLIILELNQSNLS